MSEEAPPDIYTFIKGCKRSTKNKPGPPKKRQKPVQEQNSTPPDTEVVDNSNNSEFPQHDPGPPKKRQRLAHEDDVQINARCAVDSNGGRESANEQRHTLKRQQSDLIQNLTPPITGSIDDRSDCVGSHDEQGPSRKRMKLAHEQNSTPPDTEVIDNSNDSTTQQDEHFQPRKRRRSTSAQNLTPPETELSGKDRKSNKSKSKHFTQKIRTKKHVQRENKSQEDLLTLARVDINVVSQAISTFASLWRRRALEQADTCHKVFCASRDTPPSSSENIYREGVPVLLKQYSKSPDGLFSCRIKSLHSDDSFEFEGLTNLSPETMEILRQVIKVAANRKDSQFSSSGWLSKDQNPDGITSDDNWTFCCKLLARGATSLSDQIPIKPNNLFDQYAFEEPPSTYDAWSPREFYENVCVPSKAGNLAEDDSLDPLLKGLTCQLYPFQKRAVKWLLQREGQDIAGKVLASTRNKLPHGFIRTADADGAEWLVSRCLNIATKDEEVVQNYASQIKGGILSEEMGLGKTVEMIALMCLHRRRGPTNDIAKRPTEESLVHSSATLIITPHAILRQWESELKSLAPHLKVMVYEGVRTERKKLDNDQLVARLAQYDVVLTVYNVLGREIHYTAGAVPVRNMRYNKIYERKKSPLTQIKWWRVVLDEAQMVESGVSNAAKVAQVIPREHAWAISGTPVKRDSQDLLGLLIFLRFQPYCHSVKLWNRLIQHHRDVFREIFRTLALRHTKDQVKDELQLPAQTRVIINVPFTLIEEQHYSTMYQQMCTDCGLDFNGSPLKEGWDLDSPAIIEKMRTWLARLRQTCLHPEVGIKNRRALGASKVPLRTVDEVLDVMTDQNDTATRAEERALMLSRIRRGQILEHANHSQDALRIWRGVLEEAKSIVNNDRQQLSSQVARLGVADDFIETKNVSDTEDTNTSLIGVYRHRLRSTLEIEHMCTFFVANAYFQIKSNANLTEPGSAAFKELEKLEESTYELAKVLRQEMLAGALRKADAQMEKVRAKASNWDIVEVPNIDCINGSGGIESRDVLARVRDLFTALNAQGEQLDKWRQKLVELVLLPLVDKEEIDLQGDEYETSTKQQDEVYVYMDGLRAILSDRHDYSTGQTNTRIDNEMKAAIRQAKDGEGHSPELMLKVLHLRQSLKPDPKKIGSIRGFIMQLRELKTNLRAQLDRGNVRAGAELLIINSALQNLQAVSAEQNRILTSLDQELELLKETVDGRLEYYRQLQAISDTVAPLEEDMDPEKLARTIAAMEGETEARTNYLATLKSRGRYLVHLRDEDTSLQTQRQCIICREQFDRGVLTTCGHSYCVECARLWWNAHRNCPTCKQKLTKNDFHQITYRTQDLTMQEETASIGRAAVANGDPGAIYSGITARTLNQIKSINLNGSFGSKTDAVARHILWLRGRDPGAKSVIFSQFKDFMDVLGKAFNYFGIAFTSFDRPNGIRNFKNDPSIECFFLHAKAQASGLNLVNATHVFLCEPLINTAIELQAIARVHRIGQHQPTTVWMYLIEDTVEKSIYEISVKRRLSHIEGATTSDSGLPEEPDARERQLDAANTLELQQAPLSRLLNKGPGGGEMVVQEDLWNCLFRQQPEQVRLAEIRLRAAGPQSGIALPLNRRRDPVQDVVMEGTS